MRAVAVLSVIGFHAFPNVVVGGFVGVDVFFVISGFLISGLIFPELTDGNFSFARFYARRIRRIFPALILVLASVLIFGRLLLFPDELRMLSKHVFGSGLFANNFILYKEIDYFSEISTHIPLLHLWSLGIEEQFYLAYPLFVWLLWKCRYKLPLLAVLCVASFALNLVVAPHHARAAFFLPVTRAWELLLGAILAYCTIFKPMPTGSQLSARLTRWVSEHIVKRQELLSLAGMIMIGGSLLIINSHAVWPGYLALLPTLGACAAIAGGKDARVNRVILSHPAAVYLGLISYPLYLWHWVILSFANICTGSIDLQPGTRIILVLCSLLLAVLTYHFVEKPIRKGRNLFPKAMVLGLTMSAIAVVGLCGFLTNGFFSTYPAYVQMGFRDTAIFSGITSNFFAMNTAAENAAPLRSPFDGRAPSEPVTYYKPVACPKPVAPVFDIIGVDPYTHSKGTNSSVVNSGAAKADELASGALYAFTGQVVTQTNAYLASGRHDHAAAQCAVGLLDSWAKANALTGKFNLQGASHRYWAGNGFITDFLIVRNDPGIDPAMRQRVAEWLDVIGRLSRDVAPNWENNHLYWAAAVAAGGAIAANDRKLFDWAMSMGLSGIRAIQSDGTLPRELNRRAMAMRYHVVALTGLVILAEYGAANGVDLYGAYGGKLQKLIALVARNYDNPSEMARLSGFQQTWEPISGNLVWAESVYRRFHDPVIGALLLQYRPVSAPDFGGDATLMYGVSITQDHFPSGKDSIR